MSFIYYSKMCEFRRKDINNERRRKHLMKFNYIIYENKKCYIFQCIFMNVLITKCYSCTNFFSYIVNRLIYSKYLINIFEYHIIIHKIKSETFSLQLIVSFSQIITIQKSFHQILSKKKFKSI